MKVYKLNIYYFKDKYYGWRTNKELRIKIQELLLKRLTKKWIISEKINKNKLMS